MEEIISTYIKDERPVNKLFATHKDINREATIRV
jgi:hypothetical protein